MAGGLGRGDGGWRRGAGTKTGSGGGTRGASGGGGMRGGSGGRGGSVGRGRGGGDEGALTAALEKKSKGGKEAGKGVKVTAITTVKTGNDAKTVHPSTITDEQFARRIEEIEKKMEDMENQSGDINRVKRNDDLSNLDRLMCLENKMKDLAELKVSNKNPTTKRNTTHRQKKDKTFSTDNISRVFSSGASEDFTRFYFMEVPQAAKRAINPYTVEDKIVEISGTKPRRITSSREGFVIEVSSEAQGEAICDIVEIGDIPSKVGPHNTYNSSKGLVYIYDFDVDDVELFEQFIKEEYNVISVIKAEFIKTRLASVTPLLITFNQEKTPSHLYIPGERKDTIVYPFNNKPKLCRQCWKYGHLKNGARMQKPVSGVETKAIIETTVPLLFQNAGTVLLTTLQGTRNVPPTSTNNGSLITRKPTRPVD